MECFVKKLFCTEGYTLESNFYLDDDDEDDDDGDDNEDDGDDNEDDYLRHWFCLSAVKWKGLRHIALPRAVRQAFFNFIMVMLMKMVMRRKKKTFPSLPSFWLVANICQSAKLKLDNRDGCLGGRVEIRN